MKKSVRVIAFLFLTSFMFQGCLKDTVKTTYTYFVPVYKSKTEVWNNIKAGAPTPLQKTGKLFLYGHYIFINELNKGVHIIDNSNPAAPKNISFITIPGNIDIAVKGTTLYADIFTDMAAIDISNTSNVVLKKVVPQVFPERTYVASSTADTARYIVDWVRNETTDKTEVERNLQIDQPVMWFASAEMNNISSVTKAIVGVSGSMARFTIVNNYLYTVGRAALTAFDISSASDPTMKHVSSMGWNIETIYPLKDKLFIGSQTGMFIYSIADPEVPSFVSNFSHACFNDPVIADDRYAYVTLRAATGGSCWGAVAAQRNELDIVDITNLQAPALVKIYDMAEPKGLSKDGNHLFICDGKAGLKVYNTSDVQHLQLLKTIDNINPFDVICQSGNALVVADEGIYQYNYSDINNIQLISKITVDKN